MKQLIRRHGRSNSLFSSDAIPPGKWHYVGETSEPAFQNSWENSADTDAQPLRFRVTNENTTELEGAILGGADGTVVFTLPYWARPPKIATLVGVSDGQVVEWTVQPDGDVIFEGTLGASVSPAGFVSSSRTLTAGSGLSGGGDLSADRTFDVNVDNSTIEINADTIRVKASGITANEIAADAVGSSEIAADAVGSSEIAANAVGSSELADNAVDTNAIQDGAVTNAKVTGPLDAQARVGVRKNSAGSTFTRRRINLIEGTNVTLTVADDSTDEEVDVTIAASGGGGGAVATDTIWDAKGDLAAGTGADSAARLAVGTNDYMLVADSSQTTGLKWTSQKTWSVLTDGDTTDPDLIYAAGDVIMVVS